MREKCDDECDEKWIRPISIYIRVTIPHYNNSKSKTTKIFYLSIQLGQNSQATLEITQKHNKMPKIIHTCGRKGFSTMTSSSKICTKATKNYDKGPRVLLTLGNSSIACIHLRTVPTPAWHHPIECIHHSLQACGSDMEPLKESTGIKYGCAIPPKSSLWYPSKQGVINHTRSSQVLGHLGSI